MRFRYKKDCKICYEELTILDKEDWHLYNWKIKHYAAWEEQYLPEFCKVHRKMGPYGMGCTMGTKQIIQFLTYRLKKRLNAKNKYIS